MRQEAAMTSDIIQRRRIAGRRLRRPVRTVLLAGLMATGHRSSVAAASSSSAALPCPDEESVMYNCMYGSNLLAAMDCEACLSSAVPSQINYCRELDAALGAVPDCPCAPCGREILSYVTCALSNVTGCAIEDANVALEIDLREPASVACEGLGCALVPSPDRPSGTEGGASASRSNLVACQTERNAYGTCLQSSVPSSSSSSSAALACEQCLAGSVPLPGTGAFCEDYQAATCSALIDECQGACADLGCVHELETYVGCSVTNQLAAACDIRCNTTDFDPRSSHPGCSEQVDALAVCLETYESGTGLVEACPACVSDAFGGLNVSTIGCDALEQDVCPSLQQCDCGSCGDYLEGYFACVAYTTSPSCDGLECNVTTSGAPTDDDDTSNSTSDGGSDDNSSSPICNSQLVDIRQCLLTDELGSGLYDTCPPCITDSFPNGTDASSVTCDDMSTEVCRNMKSCDCGSCQQLVGRYFDCVAVTTPASCSQVSYDTCFGLPPSPPSGSAPSAPAPSSPVAAATPTAYPSTSPVPTTIVSSPAPSAASSSTPSPSRSGSTSPVAPGECADKQLSMQTCLREQLTVAEQDCLTCVDAIDKALNDPLQNCPSIESAVCTVVSGVCSCGDCASDVNAYYSCAAAQDATNCTVSCDLPTQPPASAPGGTSGAVPTAQRGGCLWWTGIVAGVLLNAVLLQ